MSAHTMSASGGKAAVMVIALYGSCSARGCHSSEEIN